MYADLRCAFARVLVCTHDSAHWYLQYMCGTAVSWLYLMIVVLPCCFFFMLFSLPPAVCKQNKNVAPLLNNGSGTINHMQMLSSIKIQTATKTQKRNVLMYIWARSHLKCAVNSS